MFVYFWGEIEIVKLLATLWTPAKPLQLHAAGAGGKGCPISYTYTIIATVLQRGLRPGLGF